MIMFFILILNLGKLVDICLINGFILFFVWIALFQIHGELIIRPNESLLTRDQYKSFIALCIGQSDSRVIGWRSPQQRDIPENENDR